MDSSATVAPLLPLGFHWESRKETQRWFSWEAGACRAVEVCVATGAEGAGHSGDRGAGSRGRLRPGDWHMGNHPRPEVRGSERPGCLRFPVLVAGWGPCPSAFFQWLPIK